MSTLHSSAALYTRTSGDRPIGPRPLETQLEALRTRARADGVELPPEACFIDDGYSGADLQRPALERLRGLAATGTLGRLYVASPDRLARRFDHQVLLIDELHRAGVEVLWLDYDEIHRPLTGRAGS